MNIIDPITLFLVVCFTYSFHPFHNVYALSYYVRHPSGRGNRLSRESTPTILSRRNHHDTIISSVMKSTKNDNNHESSEMIDDDDVQTIIDEEFTFDFSSIEKARQKPMPWFPYRIQAIWNKPIIPLISSRNISLRVGECMLILFAIKLGSIGFSFGYIFGKCTTTKIGQIKNAPIAIVQLWTGICAIVFDVILNNILLEP